MSQLWLSPLPLLLLQALYLPSCIYVSTLHCTVKYHKCPNDASLLLSSLPVLSILSSMQLYLSPFPLGAFTILLVLAFRAWECRPRRPPPPPSPAALASTRSIRRTKLTTSKRWSRRWRWRRKTGSGRGRGTEEQQNLNQ